MKQLQLSQNEALAGFSHKYVVGFADLVALGAVLAGAVVLAPYAPGMAIQNAAYRLVTPFAGGTTATLAMTVGYAGGTTSAAGGLIASISTHLNAAPIAFGLSTGSDFATLKNGYVALDSGNIQVAFTATAGNLNALTQGEVVILLELADLTKL